MSNLAIFLIGLIFTLYVMFPIGNARSALKVNSTKASGNGNTTGADGTDTVTRAARPTATRLDTVSKGPACFTKKSVKLPGANGPQSAWYNVGGCTCEDAHDRVSRSNRKCG